MLKQEEQMLAEPEPNLSWPKQRHSVGLSSGHVDPNLTSLESDCAHHAGYLTFITMAD
jgi:hypothetical protein